MSEKWYGKIIYSGEGIMDYIEGTKTECLSYAAGFEKAKQEIEDGLSGDEDNPLDDYYTSVDQLEPIDE